MPETMRAAVFKDVRDIHIEEVPIPRCGPTDAIVRVTTTTICGTDSHIWRGESAVETADVQIGDSVVIFAQGPIGLCATAGARLRGAGLVIAVDSNHRRLEMARTMGAGGVVDFPQEDPGAQGE